VDTRIAARLENACNFQSRPDHLETIGMSKLLRLSAVKELTGLSRSAIYSDPDFPKAVKIGARAVAWVEDEIREWIQVRIAARECP